MLRRPISPPPLRIITLPSALKPSSPPRPSPAYYRHPATPIIMCSTPSNVGTPALTVDTLLSPISTRITTPLDLDFPDTLRQASNLDLDLDQSCKLARGVNTADTVIVDEPHRPHPFNASTHFKLGHTLSVGLSDYDVSRVTHIIKPFKDHKATSHGEDISHINKFSWKDTDPSKIKCGPARIIPVKGAWPWWEVDGWKGVAGASGKYEQKTLLAIATMETDGSVLGVSLVSQAEKDTTIGLKGEDQAVRFDVQSFTPDSTSGSVRVVKDVKFDGEDWISRSSWTLKQSDTDKSKKVIGELSFLSIDDELRCFRDAANALIAKEKADIEQGEGTSRHDLYTFKRSLDGSEMMLVLTITPAVRAIHVGPDGGSEEDSQTLALVAGGKVLVMTPSKSLQKAA